MRKYNRKVLVLVALAVVILVIAIWGPEQIANYKDKATLNHVTAETVENPSEGYRYALSNNEKMYILSKCLNNQIVAESQMSSMTKVDNAENVDYQELTGTYAFVVNHRGPSEQEITEERLFEVCNQGVEELKELGILSDTVKEMTASSYDAVLYSAIDVLEPRNNLSVWKVSLSTSYENANKRNRVLDVYVDAESGKIYELYVRTDQEWSSIDPDVMIEKWADYMGLTGQEAYEDTNPLLETTPNFKKYKFPGMDDGSTVVTIGFYEGINELFLKISK